MNTDGTDNVVVVNSNLSDPAALAIDEQGKCLLLLLLFLF